jgi:protein-S-isoprenylcysteine O-methyltransferase Ste14
VNAWPAPWRHAATVAGLLLLAAGGGLMIAAFAGLGKGLTPLPYPKEDGRLIETGAYRLVRHPIYGSVVVLALGWALCVHGTLTMAYTLALFLFFDVKSRREERWLAARYPGYADYQKRVRKLIPFVY